MGKRNANEEVGYCKKCGRELASTNKHRLCENCRRESAAKFRNAVAVVGTGVVTVLVPTILKNIGDSNKS